MKNSKVQGALFGVAVLVVCAWILLAPLAGTQSVATVDVQALPAPAAVPREVAPASDSAAAFLQWAQQGAALGAAPHSLQGTVVDGGVRVDAQGNVVIDENLRRLIDYFLATAGEETPEQIRARIAFYLQQNLPADAALQAWNILAQYIAYRNALADLPGHDGTYAGMLDSLREQRALRDSLLGPELSTAFFRAEDEYADFAVQHVEQLRDPALSPEEKERLTQELLANMPEESRRQIEATGAPVRIERQVETLRQQGASETEIWQLREQQFGSEAAQRLEQLDQARVQWEQRYADYRQQLQQIGNSTLDASAQQDAIARLRGELFSAPEQKRVEALDRIAASQASAATAE